MEFAHKHQSGISELPLPTPAPARGWAGSVRKSGWSVTAVVAVILLQGNNASADEALAAETLHRIKGATVFVKVDDGKEQATGSGFAIRAAGKTVYVVTNNHVVDLTPEGRPHPGAVNPTVTIVFHSGTRNEQSVRGEVIAADPRRDLAIVQVANVANAPPTLDLTQPAKLLETMPVYILGFPLGELLATNKGNPAITVGKGSVASLRTNESGELVTVQIDGDMTPGNSGGPVVDGQGRLVGVTAATVRNRRIGFAIPAATLTEGLKGRLLEPRFLIRPTAEALEVRLELGVFDPFYQLKDLSFLYLPGGKPAEKKLAGLPNVQSVNLERRLQQLVGNFTLKSAGPDPRISFQAIFTDGDQRLIVTNVRESSLSRRSQADPPPRAVVRDDVKPPPATAFKPPPPAEPRGKTTVDLLPLIDPAKDVVHGAWEINDQTLLCTQTNDWQRIEIPFRPPEEYDLVVVFSQLKLRHGVTLILPNPQGGSFWWELGGASGRRYYLGAKGSGASYVSPKFLEASTVYTTVVQVRRDSVCCLVNGQELVKRKTDYRDLSAAGNYKLRDDTLPGLACADPTIFHYVRLVEITGKGSKLP